MNTIKTKTLLLLSIMIFSPSNVIAESPDEMQPIVRSAFFGELHIHTGWSFDAYAFKVVTNPDDAYKQGKGEVLAHPLGGKYQLRKPLDFMAVTDHGWLMGVLNQLSDPDSPLGKLPIAQEFSSKDPKISAGAYSKLVAKNKVGIKVPELENKDIAASTWGKMIKAANYHNDPGKFTTFIGYEWTSTPDGANLHRNVIFAGNTAPIPFTMADSDKPEDLWRYLDNVRAKGHRVLAIPHNSNISNGLMFDRQDSFGRPLSKEYAEQRMRNEPLVEVTQIKGTSETHPYLSPNDEFADFELVEQFVGENRAIEKFAGGYVRDAYLTGLGYEDKEGFNPYHFGLVGATDGHTAIVSIEEDNYSGKAGVLDGDAETRISNKYGHIMDVRKFSASGITGLWAEENTRKSLFNAMRRKESFATTGTRMKVRLFAGYDLGNLKVGTKGWATKAYQVAVPMGSDLTGQGDKKPEFIVWAIKDPDAANLDRIQIVKGWIENGQRHEKIYDVAMSDNRVPGENLKSTVNVKEASYENSVGAAQLMAHWIDPDYMPIQRAFYYARVLEIATPRWSTYDSKKLRVDVPKDLYVEIQERAFSSPIWIRND